jgi:hypothetical protein
VQVYAPTEDSAGLQKAALKQFMQFILRVAADHDLTVMTRGAAAVLAELTPLEHTLVTPDALFAIQLAWAAAAASDEDPVPSRDRTRHLHIPRGGATHQSPALGITCNLVHNFFQAKSGHHVHGCF